MSKSPKTAKQILAEGAKKIRKAQAAAKPKRGKSVASGTSEPEVFPPIEESTDGIGAILFGRVTVNEANSAVTISPETTKGEYLRIFDYFQHQSAFAQFVLGDVINAAPAIFGEKYALALAATGRSIDTLKKYAAAARHIPAEMRTRHPSLTYTHLYELVAVPQLEDKQAIVAEAVKSAEKGKPMTAKEIRKKADKFKAKKKKAAAKKPVKPGEPTYNMSEAETASYDAIKERAETLADTFNTGVGFLFKLSFAEKKALLAALTPICNFATKLEKSLP